MAHFCLFVRCTRIFLRLLAGDATGVESLEISSNADGSFQISSAPPFTPQRAALFPFILWISRWKIIMDFVWGLRIGGRLGTEDSLIDDCFVVEPAPWWQWSNRITQVSLTNRSITHTHTLTKTVGKLIIYSNTQFVECSTVVIVGGKEMNTVVSHLRTKLIAMRHLAVIATYEHKHNHKHKLLQVQFFRP